MCTHDDEIDCAFSVIQHSISRYIGMEDIIFPSININNNTYSMYQIKRIDLQYSAHNYNFPIDQSNQKHTRTRTCTFTTPLLE